MKKVICKILCAILSLTVLTATGCAKTPEFKEYSEPIAFAVSMTYETSAWDDENTYDSSFPDFRWQAAGWYSAYLHRVEEKATLTNAEISNFFKALGLTAEEDIPSELLENGYITRTSDGYEFPIHKLMFSDMMGITTEFITEINENNVTATVRTHYDEESTDSVYRITFEKTSDKNVPYAVSSVGLPSRPVYVSPINFTLDDVYYANMASNILSMYDSVHIHIESDDSAHEVYLQNINGMKTAYSTMTFTDGEIWVDGSYGPSPFNADENGHILLYPGFEDYFAYEEYISSFFFLPEFTFISETENDITFSTEDEGLRFTYTVDKGTLLAKEIIYDGDQLSVTTITYGEASPYETFFSVWDDTREVTIVTENGADTTTDVFNIPRTWELIASGMEEGDMDYTAYLDEAYTVPYTYPGDGDSYTVYLTIGIG